MLVYLWLILGFLALYFGAEWLVEGAADIAAHLKISKTFVGLTLVAFGTSAPELFVNLIAGFNNHSEFALSNIAGSNATNFCIGFGLAALFTVVPVARREFAPDLLFAALGPILVVGSFLLSRESGLAWWMLGPMGACLAVYLVTLAGRCAATEAQDPTHLTLRKPVAYFLVGVAALYVGGQLVFQQATEIAKALSIPESIIGLTVVACGTSIPDVTASVVAARRREFSIAVGNLLGSNISNVFVVLSGTLIAARQSLPAADPGLLVDYAFVGVLSVSIAAWCLARQRVSRSFGILLLLTFVAYYTIRVGFIAAH